MPPVDSYNKLLHVHTDRHRHTHTHTQSSRKSHTQSGYTAGPLVNKQDKRSNQCGTGEYFLHFLSLVSSTEPEAVFRSAVLLVFALPLVVLACVEHLLMPVSLLAGPSVAVPWLDEVSTSGWVEAILTINVLHTTGALLRV